MANLLRMRWLLNKYVGWTIVWIVLLALIAMTVNLIGIQLAGDIQNWSVWIKAHAPVFLVWRMCLYFVAGYGWLWMRKRVIQREASLDAKQRFLRIEIGAVCALLVLEVTNWMN